MRAGRAVAGVALIAVLALGACGSRNTDEPPGRLMNLRPTHDGPDEFMILPPKPLTIPADLRALPEPVPGGPSRTDPTPLDDAVVALGGRPGAGGGDPALAAAAGRYGVAGGIREALAAEDENFRRRNQPLLLERLFGTSVYNDRYRRQAVPQHQELDRWRSTGRRTPAAPPDPARFPDARR
ncbi:MAG: DUF3035 domain-containing protein [Gemmobacter sp.]